MKAKEMFKKANVGKVNNTKVIRYGKINQDIAYELREYNNLYSNKKTKEPLYTLSFVTRKGDDLIYNGKQCKNGNFNDMLNIISICKKEKKIIKEV